MEYNYNNNYYLFSSAQDLLNEKLELPHFIKVDISNRSLKMMNTKIENYEDDENCNVDDNLEIISNEVVPNKTQFGLVFNKLINKFFCVKKNKVHLHLLFFNVLMIITCLSQIPNTCQVHQ